jgi:hypothetical protein
VKRIKKSSLRKLKEQVEDAQKQLVIKLYGRDCYTCKAKDLQGRNLQLGHIPWPRTKLSTVCKFDPAYTRIQCSGCNGPGGQGMGATATLRMQKEGIDVDALWVLNVATKGKTCNRAWFEAKMAEYTKRLQHAD